MAAPGKQSRWGSLLSQAVAGVESRLDNILAEPDESRPPEAAASATASPPPASQHLAPPSKPSPGNSRSSSSNRSHDRLQARLAQAMAGKGTTSPRSSGDQMSRPSLEVRAEDKTSDVKESAVIASEAATPEPSLAAEPPLDSSKPSASTADVAEVSAFEIAPSETTNGNEVTPIENNMQATETKTQTGNPVPDMKTEIATAATAPDYSELQKQLEDLKSKQQEEIREYVERIDSLQSKLQYLSKTAAETAKKTASSAPSGSTERKMAEKDEKIALLMEEGQKLSANEHKLRTAIKKLRFQVVDNEKQVDELKKSHDKALSDAEALQARLNGSEESDKRKEETKRATAALQKELDTLKKENSKKDDLYRRLDQEWRNKAEQAEIAQREAMSKAMATERQKQKTVDDANTGLRKERDAAVEKARQEEIEWREKLERSVERCRKLEEDFKLEMQAMEGKVEAMRTAAEEASSGSGGEAQVKLFRQIETLQSQYASARENWQGIEASLLAKSVNLEKERDEAQRRESEMRKKARDAAVRTRHLEEELQDMQPTITTVRQELKACREELVASQASCKNLETELKDTNDELEKAKQQVAEREDPVEAERRQWVDDVAGATSKGHASQPDSPLFSVTRTFSSDMMGMSSAFKPRRSHTPGSIPESATDFMSPMRRLSSQPQFRSREPSYAAPGLSMFPLSSFEPPNEAPPPPSPPIPEERENGISETMPSSPRNIAHDVISVSTVAAGPSVQLVERMSAAIRRLEAEKVTAKEEMTRVCSQRDEARSDMVGLMKELEGVKADAARLPQLEEEVASLDARYQTTLEMLGEKSELVEELKADVEDVKAMYRELIERTIK